MKKISIVTLGLLSFVGIVSSAAYSFSSLARGGDDSIYWGLFVLMPAVLISYLVYKLIKSPKIYNNFQKTICFLTIGIIIGFIQFIFFLIHSLLNEGASEVMLSPIILFIFIFILSFISAIVGLILDLKNRNKNGGGFAE